MNKSAAIYLRVSTQEQTEGYSLDEQKDKLLSYCKIMDIDVYNIYIDPGYTGSNLDRPGIQQLINDIQYFDFVLVYKLDRLSRSQKDTLHLLEDMLLPRNVNLISLSESFDTSTPFGRAMVGILSVFAQLERENIKERMLMGKAGRAKAGLFNISGQIPIGYDYIDGKLIKNEYEAIQLIMIAEMFISGKAINAIMVHLKENGYSNKYGKWKSSQTIYNILFSDLYRGRIRYKELEVYEGQHESIFDDAMCELIDAERDRRGSSDNRYQFKAKFLLTGILECSACHAKLFAYNSRGKHFYRCYSVSRSAGHMVKDPDCINIKKWVTYDLDLIIKDEIEKLAVNDDYYDNNSKGNKKASITDISDTLLKKIIELDLQIKKLMDLYQYDDIPFTEVRDRINQLSAEKKTLQNQISQYNLKQTKNMMDKKFVQKTAMDLINAWDVLENDEKRVVLRLFIDKIEICNDNIVIDWRF